MRGRNLLIVGLAIFIGLIAVYLANSYFSGMERRSEREAEANRMARIVVATQDFQFGSPITSTNIRLANWPANSVPQGAFVSIEEAIRGGRVALRPIAIGEPILATKVSGEGGRATLASILPEELRAVSIPVNPVSGVGGFVRAGDVVDVMLTRQIPGDGASTQDQMTTVVLENVLVLAIDQVADEKQTEPAVGQTATLQTDAFGAQKLTLARRIGELSLMLRNVENQEVGGTDTVTSSDLGGAGYYIAARTAAPAAAPAPATAPVRTSVSIGSSTPARPRGPTMSVVRGTEPTTYEVQRKGGW
ncbi:Flp pilus assembly protein RcpC /CpaB [Altererythrobacter epoxidivorans]|uniref:Flp pilus assembly protein RcpC /CpaB n=1 Tax=Altererythrobacter epoxidivorans TaxID=361183 RepID=A0A0M4LUZ0_9SPHN|nr:Flp pilus assembly protein CpaB [Altererythrobacter epoxidivorans]ALE16854.1 Flp pilus assembly protein RcpC /CpaB [Altererythrobacter epoxidivorans]